MSSWLGQEDSYPFQLARVLFQSRVVGDTISSRCLSTAAAYRLACSHTVYMDVGPADCRKRRRTDSVREAPRYEKHVFAL